MEEIKETQDLVEVASQKTEEEKHKLSPEVQHETTMKIIRTQQVALNNLVVLDLRNFLNSLTAPNVSQAQKKQIKESIERALVMGFDYGVDVINPNMREHGELGRLECNFAAHMARLKENGMLIIADNMSKKEKELEELANKTVTEEVTEK